MNPLLLLLSIFGVGAAHTLFSSDDSEVETRTFGKEPDDGETVEKGSSKPVEGGSSDEPTGEDGSDEPADLGPAPVDTAPAPPEQTGGTGTDGGDLADLTGEGTLDVIGGRVTTIKAFGEDVESVRIVSGVEHGKVTVNPDNTMALVMTLSDFTGSQGFTYEVTHSDGSTTTHEVGLKVTEGPQAAGWATGSNHYMLATDEDDRVVVEHGDNHVKVYISGANNALSIADIAASEGISASAIDGKWLAENGKYGQSEDLALDFETGKMLWNWVTPRHSETSNWLLFENGYDYDGDLTMRYAQGESEIHPLYIGTWGEGDRAHLDGSMSIGAEMKNVVVQGLHITNGFGANTAENVIVDDMMFTLDGMSFANAEGITVRGSSFFDIHHDTPDEAGNLAALFGNSNIGVLLEDNIFDLNGYRPGVMDPSGFNHNIYLGNLNLDVTVRDTISMRGSNVGILVRSGGFIEDNAAIDSNANIVTSGGAYKGWDHVGQYSLVMDNIVTSAGYQLEHSIGIQDNGQLSSLVDNIVTHLANPDDPDEFYEKYRTMEGIRSKYGNAYDDTIVWNWLGAQVLDKPQKDLDQNFEGLDQNVLDETTIQRFTALLLGQDTATIEDLGIYLRAQESGLYDTDIDSQTIIDYFQSGFGILPETRTEAETIRFVPDDLGDGVRWDNRLNWSTDDLPGTIAGDSVDLGGNDVVFGGNAAIENMELGDDGRLMAHNGRLTVEGEVTTSGAGGTIEVHDSGQVWVDGHTGTGLDIEIDAGRFANTGHMRDADLDIGGGEVILGSDGDQWEIGEGHALSIFDAAAKVGFDGDTGGVAILDFDTGSAARFTADSGDLGEIGEFRSGAYGDAPDLLSGIDLEGATLEIDLAGLSSAAGSAFTLMSADEIAGVLTDAKITGLGSKDATIVVDYAADTVRLELTNGSGQTKVKTVGDETDVEAGHDALWAALTADHGVADESVEVFEEDGEFAIAV